MVTAVLQAARIVNQQPDFQFPIKSDRAQSWLLTSYLDEVRIRTKTRCLAHHSAGDRVCPVPRCTGSVSCVASVLASVQ